MKKLIDGTNVDGVSADYPKGNTRDKAGVTSGTIINQVLYADMIQFFQKLVIDAAITENDLHDNLTNGYQLLDALVSKIDSVNGGLKTKYIAIGDWDMSVTAQVTLNHGLDDYKKIIPIGGVIISDDDAFGSVLGSYNIGAPLSAAVTEQSAAIGKITDSTIEITRKTGGSFDTADFENTSFNRGYIIIQYFE